MKIYLSGPISNNPMAQQLFADAEQRYSNMGEVINPLKYNNIDTEWVAAMRKNISLLMKCDTVVMLQGWEHSKGAQIEYFVAKSLNFKIMYDNCNYAQDYAQAILTTIALLADISIDDLISYNRTQNVVFARHLACYVLYQKGYTLSQIGNKINRDHTTVLHSVRVASDLLTYPNPLKALYQEFKQTTKLNDYGNITCTSGGTGL